MAETTYSYVAADFPQSKINPSHMKDEIDASAIITGLRRINTEGGTYSQGVVDDPTAIYIVFKDALSTGDKTILDGDTTDPAGGLIAAHDNSPSPDIPVMTDGTPYVHIDSAQSDGGIPAAPVGREGNERIACSHNFCDQTTWFSTSTRIEEEVFDDSGDGLTFELPSGSTDNTPWVDLVHGKVLWEDDINSSYKVVVLVDDVEMAEDPMYGDPADYSVDYDEGTVTFHSSQSGSTIKVSYSYVEDSQWILAPEEDTALILEDAEIQFSSDLLYNDVVRLAPYGYCIVFAPQLAESNGGPIPDYQKIELESRVRRYMRHDQILDEARGAYPTIGSVGGLGGHSADRYGYPLIYKTVTYLYYSYGMELRVRLENDIKFGGERATVTFYGVVQQES